MRRPAVAFWALLAAWAVLTPLAACWIGAPIYDAAQVRLREARRPRAWCGSHFHPIGYAMALYAESAAETDWPPSTLRLREEE